MKSKIAFLLLACLILPASAARRAPRLPYTLFVDSNDVVQIAYTNTYLRGVSTFEAKLGKKWIPLEQFFTTERVGAVSFPLPLILTTNTVIVETNETTITNLVISTNLYSDFRLRSVKIAPGNAFTRMALVYGDITTVAGTGPMPTGTNHWLPEYEGAIATNVPLSNPRSAVADEEGNIYVAEQDSHAVSVIGTDGRIRTAIGMPAARGPDYFELDKLTFRDANETNYLTSPTGLFYRNGFLYVLDSGNGRALKFQRLFGLGRYFNLVAKLFTQSEAFGGPLVAITNGGGLWVSADQLHAFYTDGKMLKQWDAPGEDLGYGGITIVATNFVNLSDVKVNQEGQVHVVDRGDNVVWRVDNDGFAVQVAGTGLPRGRMVGPINRQGIYGPSSIAFYSFGFGYLLGLDQGARVIYVDDEDKGATLVFGKPGVHAGDGEWFQKGRRKPKISHVQSVSIAPNGDIILVEGGYVRKIEFLRHKP